MYATVDGVGSRAAVRLAPWRDRGLGLERAAYTHLAVHDLIVVFQVRRFEVVVLRLQQARLRRGECVHLSSFETRRLGAISKCKANSAGANPLAPSVQLRRYAEPRLIARCDVGGHLVSKPASLKAAAPFKCNREQR